MGTSVRKNVIANFIGKMWTVLVSIIFVPVYVKLLREEAYGIVSFFAVMQSVLNIMGVGLQRTLRREFARTDENINEINEYKYKILRSTEFIYFIVFLIIFSMCWIGSRYISSKWLNYETLDPSMVAHVIVLMGISIGLQLIANLYAGGIYGLDLQGLANIMQMVWMTLKNAGVIPIVYFTKGNVLSFYVWVVVVDILYCLILRHVLVKQILVNGGNTWRIKDLGNLKKIWKYAAGLFLISIGTAISTQIDKIVMSKNLSIVECGAYNSASQLGGFTAYIPTIIGTAIFSNIASLMFQNRQDEAEKLFKSMNRLCTIVVVSMSAYIALFSYELILVWTGSTIYADIMRLSAPLLITGYMFNALQQIPYDYLLAQGNIKLNQGLLAFTIPYGCTITVFLTKNYGVLGASLSWLILLIIVTTVYLLIFYKLSFSKNGFKWLIKDNYRIVVIVLIPALAVRYLVNALKLSSLITVIVAVISGACTLLVLLLIFEKDAVNALVSRIKRGQ